MLETQRHSRLPWRNTIGECSADSWALRASTLAFGDLVSDSEACTVTSRVQADQTRQLEDEYLVDD